MTRRLRQGGFVVIAVLAATLHCLAQTSVLTQRNDNTRSGLNPNETALTTSTVNVNQFGKLFSVTVDDQVTAQPLYVPNVTFPGNVIHNVLIVATENDSVYAFDADSNTGANANPLWQANLLDSAHGTVAGEIPFAFSNIPACGDISPQIGVTGTPVIDAATSPGTVFVEAYSQNVTDSSSIHRLHALDITTGKEKSQGPVVIAGSVSGTGDESLNGIVQFDPHQVYNKSALLLLNGVIYISFGSHCDYSPWHGWVFAYDEASFAQKSVFATSPNSGESGIWMSGAGPAADSSGNIYLATGNGEFDTAPPVTDFGDTLLKLSTVDSHGNNGILSVADYFTPYDQQIMSQSNQELGAGGVILLPDQPGNYPHLLVQAAKTGVIYVLNRDQLTSDPSSPGTPEHYCATCTSGDPQVLQESGPSYISGIFGAPAYWNNHVFFWGVQGPLTSIPISNGLLNLASPTTGAVSPGFPGGVPSISSNGNTSGTAIVWATTKGGVYAYNAENLSQVLWTSLEGPNGRDTGGTYVKYTTPTIVNGKVYIGAQKEIDVYGLLPVVKPLNVTLGPGQIEQFTSLPGVTWSISPIGAGGISSTGLYTAPVTITTTQTVTVTAMNTGTAATAAITLVPSTVGVSAATFVQYDTTTQGNWIGTYGADGYSLAGGNQLLATYDPTFATNGATWTWASSTADPRALESNTQGSRSAATWDSTTVTFDVNLTDGQSHQVALYLLDWDNKGRCETVQVLDANSNQPRVLDQEIAINFANGTYLVWNISGHVTIAITVGGGPNSVVSGVFFGGGGSKTVTATASFTGLDTTTQGNWPAAYGSQGYALANVGQSFQIPVTFSLQGQVTWTWAASTTDSRALLLPGGPGRMAATWFSATTFTLDINLTDGLTHPVALYALGWDSRGRAEKIQILDAGTGTVLDTRNISGFSQGTYVIWNINGHVQIIVSSTTGNGVVGAVFFGGAAPPAAPSLSITKTHSGIFTQSQQNATYTITVSNAPSSSATSGTVTVTDTLPTGLTLVSLAGTGWSCTVSAQNCTRSDALASGSSYPTITVTVNVPANATSPQVNQASVSGGGSTTASASDSTTIAMLTAPTLSVTKTHTGNFAQSQQNATYTITVSNAVNAAATSGTVTVTDALPTGLTLVALGGTGWTCTVSTDICTRSDALAGGISYPTITVTVDVAANATSPQINQACVSGGGSATASASDSTSITTPTAPSLSVTKTHTGNFTQAQQNATYTITVSNGANASATTGMVTVTDTLPSGLTLVSLGGTGWNCTLSSSSCTRSDALAGGASYVAITATVNVAANASSPQVNQASVSGGGSATANASDSTVISTTGDGSSAASASFIAKDTQTEGSWQGPYGTDGYDCANGPQSVPPYATFTVQSQMNWTWMANTSDPRALQLPGSTGGIAATWYANPGPFTFNVNVGTSPHTFAIYALDWDNQGRSEMITIRDATTGLSLDTETIGNFGNGIYVAWTITGNVQITVTSLSGPNAVVSGVFFGGSGAASDPPPPTSTAKFTGSDSITQGKWIGTYGTLGYDLANSSESLPASVAVNTQNQAAWIWAPSSTDPRALQIPNGGGSVAATWYSAPTLTFDVNLTDGLQHQVTLYLMDWDNKGRAETIQIVDATSGTILDAESIPGSGTSTTSTNLVNGTYLKWTISGHVKINFLVNGGPNAVASGIFFD
jgi:uncharacterized repeat protein (TIGR01451 family)